MSTTKAQRLLDAIAAEIRGHVPCGFEICEQATNLVPGEGSATAPVVVVGEAPVLRLFRLLDGLRLLRRWLDR